MGIFFQCGDPEVSPPNRVPLFRHYTKPKPKLTASQRQISTQKRVCRKTSISATVPSHVALSEAILRVRRANERETLTLDTKILLFILTNHPHNIGDVSCRHVTRYLSNPCYLYFTRPN